MYVGQVVGGGVVVSLFVICVILVLGFLMCVGSSQWEMGCPSIVCASLQLFWMFFVMYFGRRESGGGLFLVLDVVRGLLLFSMLVLIVSLCFS